MIIQDEEFNFKRISDDEISNIIKNKFVIALDFDGVITNTSKLKTKYINELGYTIKEEESGRETSLKLGVLKKDYLKGSKKAYMESPRVLPLEKYFLKFFSELRNFENVALCIVTSRYDDMLFHLQEYLKFHKIKFDGIIHTHDNNKIDGLRKINAKFFIDDSIFKLNEILEKDNKFYERCCLVLFRNKQNKNQGVDKMKIIDVNDWNELRSLLANKIKDFDTEKQKFGKNNSLF